MIKCYNTSTRTVLNISAGYNPAVEVYWAMWWPSLHMLQVKVTTIVVGVPAKICLFLLSLDMWVLYLAPLVQAP